MESAVGQETGKAAPEALAKADKRGTFLFSWILGSARGSRGNELLLCYYELVDKLPYFRPNACLGS